MEEVRDQLQVVPLAYSRMGYFVILPVKINLMESGQYAGKNAHQLTSLAAQPSVLLIYKNAINRHKTWLSKLSLWLPHQLLLTQQDNMTYQKLSNPWVQLQKLSPKVYVPHNEYIEI